MRRDFDYVTMDDYIRDMAESASHAAAIIDGTKRQKRDAELRMIALALASGGTVFVPDSDLAAADQATVRLERDEARGGWKFIALR